MIMKFNKFYALPTILALSMFLSSCASIVSKNHYPINISSTPSEANIEIKDAKGKIVHSGKTPAIVSLKTKKAYFQGMSYSISFSKAGYQTHTIELKPRIDGWYIGNCLFGVPGLVVDPLTGSMWSLPKEVCVDLKEMNNELLGQALSLNGDENRINVITLGRLPLQLRDKLIAVE